MDKISSTDFQRDFGRTLSTAKRHPITITSRGRDEVVLLDVSEYERLKKRDTREYFHVADLPQEDFDAILNTELPPEGEGLDHLLK